MLAIKPVFICLSLFNFFVCCSLYAGDAQEHHNYQYLDYITYLKERRRLKHSESTESLGSLHTQSSNTQASSLRGFGRLSGNELKGFLSDREPAEYERLLPYRSKSFCERLLSCFSSCMCS